MSSPKPEAALEEPVSQSPTAQKPDTPGQDSAPEPAEQQNPSPDREPGEASEEPESPAARNKPAEDEDAPPLPNEPTPDGPPLPKEPAPSGPPLPNEPTPQSGDDGWDCQWDPNTHAWFFINRFTGKSQWENPRVVTAPAVPPAPGTHPSLPQPPASEKPAAGGYNPAIHGDYDPNAWYAKGNEEDEGPSTSAALSDPSDIYAATASFNRFTGQFQTAGAGPERHSDEAKSRRQMNAFFDVEAAANAHDGRSLKAERSGKKPSKAELKQFKEKRRARKEEKRRAWLRD
ncbi:WW domain-containing [Fusarium albosuccineum]|uniref:WW domain-containing n=1 Tax=Fusarium albosuccineum TaxID=1237068 RepID=A0A8H4P207_9HYPO|nr:WW domain-containing [Fusarium albosuccineum]